MNNIKSSFSIKDLENLTGIKAHTIRIWEKRYKLIEPDRTDTNIRLYSLENLQLLLNISYLKANGYKISKIAELEINAIPELVKEIAKKDSTHNHAMSTFKLAMLNFDQKLFYETYASLEKEKGFLQLFHEDLVPFMGEIGLLWQTDTITPAHEHFLMNLIRQKLLVSTEELQSRNQIDHKQIFVLFLPDNEVHELGLMLVNYEVISKGYQAIYLGQSVPIDSLKDLLNYYDEITFISYFTVKPEKAHINDYIKEFEQKLLMSKKINLWLLGRMVKEIDLSKLNKQIVSFKSIEELVKKL
ncbi:MerR family transcriptional regulator [Subsaximicrobium wynnwilliamsii]|uniref:MerR family transcriptional regulator n=1 Tax=Subsaximicrobium wynnwilliamsii TaxID=291179 RepID=A0A5C6ZJB3_9FLAO|nr:MerR family transcriptional regulator [Subsaximicrobium wynnwilliamsii]TXD84228.1 MerR family transcriptional regulator [Subsaximicrobium wynnwilliamsii]TXD89849.1 MerR family transcriptional regulator [Subsaximicrobium wynnwilliamsii]TXE03940.1 MerR family transcriptional regulator [Subsaximicrobium wynnwilliamsii]